MQQDAPLWWQEENIIVRYRTDETVEEVASRMISPRPVPFPNDDPYYDQLYETHLLESEGIPRLLRELNPPGSATGIVFIPAPGWWVSSKSGIIRHSGRTLYDLPSSERYEVEVWWEELSPVEQEIELALAATSNARPGSANFDNIRSFEFVMEWIAKNSKAFEDYSGNGMLKALPELLIASEYLFDYGGRDGQQDFGVRHSIVPDERAWNSVGISNVHYATLFDAYYRIQAQLEEGSEHPWHSNSNAPDLSTIEQLEPDNEALQAHASDIYMPQGRWTDDSKFSDLAPEQQEAVRFSLLDEMYAAKLADHPELRQQIAQYLVTDEGAIHAASMIAHMYLNDYISTNWEAPQDILQIAEDLAPEDMARIWGRYRSGLELFERYPVASGELGPNARLALPIAEHLLEGQ